MMPEDVGGWNLQGFADALDKMDKANTEIEAKQNQILDDLITAMAEEDPLWWAKSYPYAYAILTEESKSRNPLSSQVVRMKREIIRDYVLPAIRAGIRAGHVLRREPSGE